MDVDKLEFGLLDGGESLGVLASDRRCLERIGF